jgi:hypothetical protein
MPARPATHPDDIFVRVACSDFGQIQAHAVAIEVRRRHQRIEMAIDKQIPKQSKSGMSRLHQAHFMFGKHSLVDLTWCFGSRYVP